MFARCDLADNPLEVCRTLHVDTRADLVTDAAVEFHVGDQSMVDVVPLLCVHEEFHVGNPPVIAFWMLPWPVKDVGELDKGHATPGCQWQHAPENEMISSYQSNAFGLSSQRTFRRTETLQWSNGLDERNNNNICVVYQCIFIYTHIHIHTSSTAQGGGGSFKNRKPIGEVGCCESRMEERIHWWTERWLELCFLERLQWLQWYLVGHLTHNCWM